MRGLNVICAVALMAASASHGYAQSERSDALAQTAQGVLRGGIMALRSGDAAGAVNQLTRALSSGGLSPSEAAYGYFHRAAAHQQLKACSKAIGDYDQALSLAALPLAALPGETVAMAHYNRGLCWLGKHRSEQALDDFSRAIERNSEFAKAHNARGDALSALGRYQDAIAAYQAALRYSNPEPHLTLFSQAKAHFALSQIEGARAALERALLVEPDFAAARDALKRLARGERIDGLTPDRSTRREAETKPDEVVSTAGAVPAGEKANKSDVRPTGGFFLQLSTQYDAAAARAVWRTLVADNHDVLGNLTVHIEPVELGNDETFYWLRAGPFRERQDTEQVCNVLKARGNRCSVISRAH